MRGSLYIVTVAILSMVLNIYLLYKVLTLQNDLESKKVDVIQLKNRPLVMGNKWDKLEGKYLASKAINESLIRELESNRKYITNLKLVIYENISSYYKRGNKDE